MNDDMVFKIHQLLDGELGSQEAAEVFTLLANSPELQREFLQAAIFNRTIRRQQLQTPPPSSTVAIFKKLGFLPAGKATQAFILGIILGIIASVLFGLLFLHRFQRNNAMKNTVVTVPKKEMIFTLPSLHQQYSPLDNRSDDEHPLQSLKDQKPQQYTTGALPKQRAHTILSSSLLHPTISYHQEIIKTHPMFFSNTDFTTDRNQFLQLSTIPSNAVPPISGLEYRTFHTLYTLPSANESLRTPGADFSIDVILQRNNYHLYGIAFGRSEFSQRFSSQQRLWNAADEDEAETVQVHYEQVPRLWWIGAFYQQRFPLPFHAELFTGITAAISRLGPIGKVSLGGTYFLSPAVGIEAGIEGNILAYSYSQKIYTTKNLTVFYGLKVHF